MPEPAVALHDVGKAFDGQPVLEGVSASIAAPELVAIVGPSGAGKTTLLRLIAGLAAPDRGTIERLGEALPRQPRWPGDPRVAFVFQEGRLFPHLSVLDNCLLGPVHGRHQPRPQARKRVMAVLESLGVAAYADQFPHQLSGGQRQRVAVARGLALNPELLLLDEVTASLDPENVANLLAVLTELVRREGVTCLFNTHHLGFAEATASRLLFLDGGRLRADGSPRYILRESQDPRVRSFVDALRRTDAPGG